MTHILLLIKSFQLIELVSSSSISDDISEKENDSTSKEVVQESADHENDSKEVVNELSEVIEQSLNETPIPAPRKLK